MHAKIDKITEAIKKIVSESDSKGVVVALSGGVDSSVVLKLASLSEVDTLALIMPDEGVTREEDVSDARELAESLGVKYTVFEINPVYDSVNDSFPWSEFVYGNVKLSKANVKPRIRMLFCYLVANLDKRIVLGTSNRSEILLGYMTKYGDSAADIEPIGDLYKTEVYELARFLEIPEKIIAKKPSAGLWMGQTDEDELGLKYEDLDKILKSLFVDNFSVEETAARLIFDAKLVEEVNKRVERNKHKTEPVKVVRVT